MIVSPYYLIAVRHITLYSDQTLFCFLKLDINSRDTLILDNLFLEDAIGGQSKILIIQEMTQ